MHSGTYVFQQITSPFKRQFNRIVCRYDDRTKGWAFTHWNFLCVLIFGQLSGCSSLRELVDIITAHAKRAYHLGFGTNGAVTYISGTPIVATTRIDSTVAHIGPDVPVAVYDKVFHPH